MFRLSAGLVLCAGLLLASGKASSIYKQGQRAEQEGDFARAYLLYAQAAAMDPDNRMYWLRSEALRTQAAMQAKVRPQFSAPLTDAGETDTTVLGEATLDVLAEARKPQPPAELAGSPERRSFELTGNYKELWESVAKLYGLDVVFDGDYQEGSLARLQMLDADYREALHGAEAVTGSFVIPIAERLFLVAADTDAKRRDVSPTVTVVIPVPEPVSLQEVTELTQAVRQTMDTQKFFVDSQRRLVVLRDQVAKVRPAQLLFEQLLHGRPEISLEVDFLEVSKSKVLSYGLNFQTSSMLAYLGGALGSAPFLGPFSHFLTFGGGKSLFGIGVIGNPILQIIANTSRSDVKNAYQAMGRSVDGQPAKLHAGLQYPIMTVGYFGPIDPGGGEVFRPPPNFTFEELGVVVNFTPRVHGTEAVTLELDLEFKLLTGEALNGIPVISNRKMESTVRLRFDEAAVVTGLVSAAQARTISGLAGVANLPVLGPFVRRNEIENEDRELLIVLRPRLLRLPPTEFTTEGIRVGSESRPLSPL